MYGISTGLTFETADCLDVLLNPKVKTGHPSKSHMWHNRIAPFSFLIFNPMSLGISRGGCDVNNYKSPNPLTVV